MDIQESRYCAICDGMHSGPPRLQTGFDCLLRQYSKKVNEVIRLREENELLRNTQQSLAADNASLYCGAANWKALNELLTKTNIGLLAENAELRKQLELFTGNAARDKAKSETLQAQLFPNVPREDWPSAADRCRRYGDEYGARWWEEKIAKWDEMQVAFHAKLHSSGHSANQQPGQDGKIVGIVACQCGRHYPGDHVFDYSNNGQCPCGATELVKPSTVVIMPEPE